MKAVVLFNLGGPTSLDAVEPFLFNLFSDPDIIKLPGFLKFLQHPIARFISRRRGPEARHNYELIGGKSPLLENTRAQAAALETALGTEYRVLIAMRYWEPRAEETVAELRKLNPDEIILLPLYPQYSIATTVSSFNDFTAALKTAGWNPKIKKIEHYFDQLGYITPAAASIRAVLSSCDAPQAHLLFSAHGLPESFITKLGDPYQKQIEESVARIIANLSAAGGPPVPHSLCYQSRVGPLKWLGPDIETALTQLAQGDRKTVVVYPISFVSEHVETLFELDIMYGDKAKALGLDYRRVRTLGVEAPFIHFMADLVRNTGVA